MLPDETYTPERIASWLLEHNFKLSFWLNSQVLAMNLWIVAGEDQRAQWLLDRASAIREQLREMGAVHLLH